MQVQLATGQIIKVKYPAAYLKGQRDFEAGVTGGPARSCSDRERRQYWDGYWADNELDYVVEG